MSSINIEQARRFAHEYVINHNGFRAYVRVYGTKDESGNERTLVALRSAASRLATNRKVKAEIAAAQADLNKACNINAKRMLRQLVSMATVDPADLFGEDGDKMVIKPIHTIPPMVRKSLLKIKIKRSRRVANDEPFEIEEIEYTLQDRYPAIEKLCKRLGIIKDDAEWSELVAVAVAAIQAAGKPHSDASLPNATNGSDPVGGDARVESI